MKYLKTMKYYQFLRNIVMINNVNLEQTISKRFPNKILSLDIKSSVMIFSCSVSKDCHSVVANLCHGPQNMQ